MSVSVCHFKPERLKETNLFFMAAQMLIVGRLSLAAVCFGRNSPVILALRLLASRQRLIQNLQLLSAIFDHLAETRFILF